jgi:hypothetical protein
METSETPRRKLYTGVNSGLRPLKKQIEENGPQESSDSVTLKWVGAGIAFVGGLLVLGPILNAFLVFLIPLAIGISRCGGIGHSSWGSEMASVKSAFDRSITRVIYTHDG